MSVAVINLVTCIFERQKYPYTASSSCDGFLKMEEKPCPKVPCCIFLVAALLRELSPFLGSWLIHQDFFQMFRSKF
jgi:hypothetical protein